MTREGYPGVLTSEAMEALMREYFDACNDSDIDRIAACFESDAVHYFPPGMYAGPFRGARTIAERWTNAVANLGSVWTIDQIVVDADSGRAVMEWTHFKTFEGTVLRGDEWYEFDPESGLIQEIRAYYASPQDKSLSVLALGDFDYLGRGYALDPPFTRQR